MDDERTSCTEAGLANLANSAGLLTMSRLQCLNLMFNCVPDLQSNKSNQEHISGLHLLAYASILCDTPGIQQHLMELTVDLWAKASMNHLLLLAGLPRLSCLDIRGVLVAECLIALHPEGFSAITAILCKQGLFCKNVADGKQRIVCPGHSVMALGMRALFLVIEGLFPSYTSSAQCLQAAARSRSGG